MRNEICTLIGMRACLLYTSKMCIRDRYAVKVNELEKEILEARYLRILAYQRVRNCIEELENEREKMLLTYRYIRGLKWEEICVKMDYKWRQVHRIHANALKNLKMA